jgi:hypothetical protein
VNWSHSEEGGSKPHKGHVESERHEDKGTTKSDLEERHREESPKKMEMAFYSLSLSLFASFLLFFLHSFLSSQTKLCQDIKKFRYQGKLPSSSSTVVPQIEMGKLRAVML